MFSQDNAPETEGKGVSRRAEKGWEWKEEKERKKRQEERKGGERTKNLTCRGPQDHPSLGEKTLLPKIEWPDMKAPRSQRRLGDQFKRARASLMWRGKRFP